MTLYLLEKDTQAKPLKKALNELGKKENKDYIVIPLSGHIFRSLKPNEYSDGIKNWNTAYKEGKLPYIPKKWIYVLNTEDKKYAKRNKEKLKRLEEAVKKCNQIVLAPDPDPEGASLAYEAVEYLNATDKIIGMINMSDTTVSALKKEINKLSIKNWKELVASARGRQKSDWILGFNLTMVASVLYGSKLKGQTARVGPVKSVIMSLVVDRDLQYENFSKIPYWYITGNGKKDDIKFSLKFLFKKEDDDKIKWESKLDKKEIVEKYLNELKNNNIGKVIKLEKKNKTTKPPKPLTKTSLQSLLGQLYGFNLKKVQDIMQSLYEGKHGNKNEGYISYPRTDIDFYSIEEYKLFPSIVKSLKNVDEFKNLFESIDENNIIFREKLYFDPNNKKKNEEIPPHFALRPTTRNDLDKLSKDERKVYNVIFAYWLFQLYPDYEYENISGEIKTILDKVKATFSSNKTIKKGWKEVEEKLLNKKVIEEHTIPLNIKKDDEIKLEDLKMEEGYTKPKPRFTETSLSNALGKIANLYDDKEIKRELKDTGIGTPATRDIHIMELINSDFFKKIKEGKKTYLVSTEKTRNLVKLLPEELKNPIMRAKMEQFINKAKTGAVKEEEIVKYFTEKTKEFIKQMEQIAKENNIQAYEKLNEKTDFKCPLCNGNIIEKDNIFICENNKWNPRTKKSSGCPFVIIKKTKFYSLDKEKLEKLLNNEEIEFEKGTLKLNLDNKYFTDFKFNNSFSNDPNKLIETNKTYRLGDKFIFKTFRNKKLTKKEAENILKGKTITLSLKDKQGKKYSLKVKLGEKGTLEIIS